MEILYRFIVLIITALAGYLLNGFAINIIIKADFVPPELNNSEFFEILVRKTVFVWMGATVIGTISIFINKPWRKYLLLFPLLGSSIFALLYAISL